MLRVAGLFATLAVALVFILPVQAHAQSSTNYGAAIQWGTYSSGIAVTGAVDSAVAHNQNGVVAGQVNAAKLGALVGSGGDTINAIGSQTIVSTSIIGSGDTSSINATQTSSNTGAVKNAGQIGQSNFGNSTN
jgi:hypothetical protein